MIRLSGYHEKQAIPVIPDSHPRAQSLHYRHLLVEAMQKKIVAPSGLCAHGRGEAFDYLLGEKTIPSAIDAIDAAIALLLLAKNPVISVNGNIAALIPCELAEFSEISGIPLEINLFYQTPGRTEAIKEVFQTLGVKNLLGLGDVPPSTIQNLESNRRIVDPRGIGKADVVLVPLEDGDRTEALVKSGKTVITVDLNPLSRTAKNAHITIVDNIIRVLPIMIRRYRQMKDLTHENLKAIGNNYNQGNTLNSALNEMVDYLREQQRKSS